MYRLIIHRNLKDILIRVKNQSEIANNLLQLSRAWGPKSDIELVKDPVNYVRVSKCLTKISYLDYKSWKKYKSEGYRKDDLFYHVKGRVKIRFGAFLKKIFKNLNPKDVEKFASLIKSEVNRPPYRFKEFKGEFGHLFHYSKTKSDSGQLGASCMRHDRCQAYLSFYNKNPKITLLAMITDSGQIVGRALLWRLGKENGLDKEFLFMDRIYCIRDEYMHYFVNWANKNNFYIKEKQSWSRPYHFKLKGKVEELKLKIKVKTDFRFFPYLDTFKWLDTKEGWLYNYLPDNLTISQKKNLKSVVSTFGQLYSWGYMREDTYHKEYAYEKELAWVDYKQHWIKKDYLIWSRINKTYLLEDDGEYCKILDDYIFNEKYKELNSPNIKLKREKILRKIELEKKKLEKSIRNTVPIFMKFVEQTKDNLFYENYSFSIIGFEEQFDLLPSASSKKEESFGEYLAKNTSQELLKKIKTKKRR